MKRFWVLDAGPPLPEPPAKPALPEGAPGTPAYQVAMVPFNYALAAYTAAYGEYLAKLKEYSDFGERPKKFQVDAFAWKEMKARGGARYTLAPESASVAL